MGMRREKKLGRGSGRRRGSESKEQGERKVK